MNKKIFAIVALLLIPLYFLLTQEVTVNIEETEEITLPADLEQYLAESEAEFDDLVAGTEKKIKWSEQKGEKTELALVYLHGFSASRQETAPLADQLAEELGANLFYTRLTGHGRSGEAMGESSVNDWIKDAQEALEIARRIGEEVILIGTSTGGTLASYLALEAEQDDILSLILLSPNYGVDNSLMRLANYSWFRRLLPIFMPERSFEVNDSKQQRYWTNNYPVTAVFTMLDLLNLVEQSNLAKLNLPIQIIYSPNDDVVSPDKIEQTFAEFASDKKQLIALENVQDPSNHVLAGDILSPDNTEFVKNEILQFILELK